MVGNTSRIERSKWSNSQNIRHQIHFGENGIAFLAKHSDRNLIETKWITQNKKIYGIKYFRTLIDRTNGLARHFSRMWEYEKCKRVFVDLRQLLPTPSHHLIWRDLRTQKWIFVATPTNNLQQKMMSWLFDFRYTK